MKFTLPFIINYNAVFNCNKKWICLIVEKVYKLQPQLSQVQESHKKLCSDSSQPALGSRHYLY